MLRSLVVKEIVLYHSYLSENLALQKFIFWAVQYPNEIQLVTKQP